MNDEARKRLQRLRDALDDMSGVWRPFGFGLLRSVPERVPTAKTWEYLEELICPHFSHEPMSATLDHFFSWLDRSPTWHYWPGLTASKSTGQTDFEQAALAAENMVRNGGKQGHVADIVLSDEEFVEIQRRHFGRKADRKRAEQTLYSCLNAIAAFQAITGLHPVTTATPDDCARFQNTAETLSKNWRHDYPKSKKEVEYLSRNTIVKWSRTLQAAFQRANKNAGKKCVRGVVEEHKLLTRNPWQEFTWIEGHRRKIRQFDPAELVSLLDVLEKGWPEVTVATAVAKTLLWS